MKDYRTLLEDFLQAVIMDVGITERMVRKANAIDAAREQRKGAYVTEPTPPLDDTQEFDLIDDEPVIELVECPALAEVRDYGDES